MSGLGKRRPARARSGTSGLTQKRSNAESGARRQAYDTGTSASGSSAEVLEVTALTHDGRGIARTSQGKAVFIEGALPGEHVTVAVHRTRKRFDEAHVREVQVSAAQRVTPPCPYVDRCGGCDLQHLALDAQRRHKVAVLANLLSRQGIELPGEIQVLSTATVGYRRRARLSVRVSADGEVQLGFRARRSRRLVEVDACTTLVPELSAMLPALYTQLVALEAPRHVGHIELLHTEEGVTLVLRQLRRHVQDLASWQQWAREQGVRLAMRVGREAPEFEWLEPEDVDPSLTLKVPSLAQDLTLRIAPGDFFQANDGVNRCLVETALAWLGKPDGGQSLLDLFAGVGNFSLPLAAAGYTVAAVEGQQEMVARLNDNACRLALEVHARQANLHDSVSVEQLLDGMPADVVVLDPPREGAEALCQALSERPVSKVLYIACDPATMVRDSAYLLRGGYRLERAAMADMFVHTSHLESMLLFVRD